MDRRLVRAMHVFAMFILIVNGAKAQPYKKLSADDFSGSPQSNSSGVVAYTNCTIDFKYQASRRNGYYSLECNIRLLMNSYKSWLDRSRILSADVMQEVLKHEQGHYDIAYLEQQELRRAVGETRFDANYQAEAMNIFNRIDAKYKQLNHDYDEDTGHMLNKVQQNSWNVYFKKRLNYMPPS